MWLPMNPAPPVTKIFMRNPRLDDSTAPCHQKILLRAAGFFAKQWVVQPTANHSLPRILFVHDYRPDSLHTADLIRQLFLGFPPANLAWWSFRQTGRHAKPDLRAARCHEFPLPDRLVPHVRLAQLKSVLLENFWVPRAARDLERVIAVEKPDVVVALLFGWSLPVLAKVCWSARPRLHVSLWDFPDTNGVKKILGHARSERFVSAIHALVRRADTFDAICPGTLAELRAHTGRHDGLLVHSGFEPHHLQALENFSGHGEPGIVRIAYVGTIISENGFLEMLDALNTVRATLPQKVVLEFFGGRNYRSRAWFDPEWMAEHGLFTDDGLVAALRRCDWGVVVMDPAGEDLRYSRFSFPNKVGTYLSAGVPVLGFGNPQSSLAQLMQEHRLGRFTSVVVRDELVKFLSESLRLPAPREFYRAEILECAHTEFNAAEMRARLWRLWGADV
jgi:glycosyltransferase involved in cell wall biosynthesis